MIDLLDTWIQCPLNRTWIAKPKSEKKIFVSRKGKNIRKNIEKRLVKEIR